MEDFGAVSMVDCRPIYVKRQLSIESLIDSVIKKRREKKKRAAGCFVNV